MSSSGTASPRRWPRARRSEWALLASLGPTGKCPALATCRLGDYGQLLLQGANEVRMDCGLSW